MTPRPLKLLLLSDDQEFTSEQQFEPFYTYRSQLRKRLSCVFQHALISHPNIYYPYFDAIGLKLSFRKSKEDVLRLVREICAQKAENTPLLYFDGDDDLGIQHPEVLPYVSLYIKKHLHKDLQHYLKERIGKSHLTDYVAQTYGISFADDPIPSSQALDQGDLPKLWGGWNLALDRRIQRLYHEERANGIPQKTLDIVYRASIPQDWIGPLRSKPQEILSSFDPSYLIRLPTAPVPLHAYYDELRSSRLCISPFGYGEICWRDFEAVIFQSLLLKPDVSHLITTPNIFIPYETYVPLKWDYADLEEKCRFYLEHPEERKRITQNAYRVLSDYYENDTFLLQAKDLIERTCIGI